MENALFHNKMKLEYQNNLLYKKQKCLLFKCNFFSEIRFDAKFYFSTFFFLA
jgi:hypothetical protein